MIKIPVSFPDNIRDYFFCKLWIPIIFIHVKQMLRSKILRKRLRKRLKSMFVNMLCNMLFAKDVEKPKKYIARRRIFLPGNYLGRHYEDV